MSCRFAVLARDGLGGAGDNGGAWFCASSLIDGRLCFLILDGGGLTKEFLWRPLSGGGGAWREGVYCESDGWECCWMFCSRSLYSAIDARDCTNYKSTLQFHVQRYIIHSPACGTRQCSSPGAILALTSAHP